jgi:hypothetical protein
MCNFIGGRHVELSRSSAGMSMIDSIRGKNAMWYYWIACSWLINHQGLVESTLLARRTLCDSCYYFAS